MTSHQNIFGLVDTRGEIRRPPVVGMQFLHERPVRTRDILTRRAFPKPQDFIRFLLRHLPPRRDRPSLPAARRRVASASPAARHPGKRRSRYGSMSLAPSGSSVRRASTRPRTASRQRVSARPSNGPARTVPFKARGRMIKLHLDHRRAHPRCRKSNGAGVQPSGSRSGLQIEEADRPQAEAEHASRPHPARARSGTGRCRSPPRHRSAAPLREQRRRRAGEAAQPRAAGTGAGNRRSAAWRLSAFATAGGALCFTLGGFAFERSARRCISRRGRKKRREPRQCVGVGFACRRR